MTKITQKPYRQAVGIVVKNEAGEVLTGMRNWPPHLFKMPQGGKQPGETDEQTLARELFEETGISEFRISQKSLTKYTYEFDADNDQVHHRHRGQELTWFLVETGQRNLDPKTFIPLGDDPEFTAFVWTTPENVVALSHNDEIGNKVSIQRQQMYQNVLTEFDLLPKRVIQPRATEAAGYNA